MSIDESQTINSYIDEVTVYRGNALISRKVEISSLLKDSIKIPGLPIILDDSSIRIKITSTDNFLQALDFRVILEVPEQEKELPPPDNKKLTKLKQMREKLNFQINSIEKFLERLKSSSFHTRGIPKDTQIPTLIPISSRKMFLDFLITRKKKLDVKRRDLQNRKDKLEIDLFQLEDTLNRESTVRQNRENELKKSVIINIATTGKLTGKSYLYLDYLIPGAQWFPVYGLNISEDYSKYFLTMRTMVKQQTGEDWGNVQINFSTAEAVRWMELPQLSSRIIGRPKPSLPVSGWRKAPEGSSALFSDYDNYKQKLQIKMQEQESQTHSISSHIIDDKKDIFFGESEESEEVYDEEENEKEMIMDYEMPMVSYAAEMTEPKMSKKLRSLALSKSKPDKVDGLAELDGLVESDNYAAGSDLLEYNKMRLGSIDSEARGKLKKAPVHEQYMVSIDKANRISESVSFAYEAGTGGAPVNCTDPVPYDGFDYSFVADARVDIPSDAHYHTQSLSSFESDGQMSYVSVPRESSEVFRFIRFTNPMDAPVLAGPVDISINGNYLLASSLGIIPPGGGIKLGIGVEQSIKLSRNTQFKEETSGLIKGNLGLNHYIDIDLENNLGIVADVEIRERIPIPPSDKSEKEEKIKVEVLKVNPEWEEYDQEPNYLSGGYRWKVGINPGEKRKFHVHYVIQISSQFEIVDGNRREN